MRRSERSGNCVQLFPQPCVARAHMPAAPHLLSKAD